MPLQHQKSVHHIILPIPKLSVLQLGNILSDYNSYIESDVYIGLYVGIFQVQKNSFLKIPY